MLKSIPFMLVVVIATAGCAKSKEIVSWDKTPLNEILLNEKIPDKILTDISTNEKRLVCVAFTRKLFFVVNPENFETIQQVSLKQAVTELYSGKLVVLGCNRNGVASNSFKDSAYKGTLFKLTMKGNPNENYSEFILKGQEFDIAGNAEAFILRAQGGNHSPFNKMTRYLIADVLLNDALELLMKSSEHGK